MRQLDETKERPGPLTGLPQFVDVAAIAAGTTGQVFRARQPATDRLVAVKVLGLAVFDPRVRARFDREVATSGRLSAHPYIVTLLDHGVTPAGYPYLVMPWYDNGSLADDLMLRPMISLSEALAIGVRVGAALDHAHRQDVLHRDVKPANILRSGHGEWVLADFGGAVDQRQLGLVTSAYTPVHAAPELLRGQPAQEPSDVWSLASTVYTALAGRRPFAAAHRPDGLAAELSRVVADPPPLLDRPDLPQELGVLLAAGLAKRPEDRPTALQLATGLQGIQARSGLPITEIPPPPPSGSAVLHAGPPAAPDGQPGLATLLRPVPPQPRPRRQVRASVIAGGLLLTAALGVIGAALVAPQFDARAATPPTAATMRNAPTGGGAAVAADSLQARGNGGTSITVRWHDTNAGDVGYQVLIDPAPDGFASGAVPLGRGITSLTVRGLRPGTSYCFRVASGGGPVTPVTSPICTSTR